MAAAVTTYDHEDPTRPIPENLPPGLRYYALLAQLFDQAFRVPGTSWRFGLDPLLGLIPGAGDLFGAAVGMYGVWLAGQLGAPSSVIARMLVNLFIDSAVGTIPLAGDLFDFGFKANTRNRVLLEAWLANPRGARRSSRAFLVLLAVVLLASFAGFIWLIVAGIRALVHLLS
jgi:hypothetical protein